MKAHQARAIAEKASCVDNTENILTRIGDAAKKGLTALEVEAAMMTKETQVKLRSLGYHMYRGSSGLAMERIRETDTYVVSW